MSSIPELSTFLNSIQGLLAGLGGTIFLICITVAGIMRMTAGGNERRVAISNMAFAAAVVGLAIILLGAAFRDFIQGSL